MLGERKARLGHITDNAKERWILDAVGGKGWFGLYWEVLMDTTALMIFLVSGAIAGGLAGGLMRRGGFGLLGNVALGVIGAVAGSFVFGLLGISASGLIGLFAPAIVGAGLLLFIAGMIRNA